MGLPVLRALPLCTCCRHYPGTATGIIFALSPSRISLPQYGSQVGPCIVLFEACSAFTRVTACPLALSPYVVTRFTRRLQRFRYLHRCSGCFRLEQLPGGTCTHWKAPPFTAHARSGRRESCQRRPITPSLRRVEISVYGELSAPLASGNKDSYAAREGSMNIYAIRSVLLRTL